MQCSRLPGALFLTAIKMRGMQYRTGTKFIPVKINMKGTVNTSTSFSLASKVKDYFQLIKFTLSFTVVFSCVICYLLAPNVVEYNWWMIFLLFVAGMLITGSANAINQAVEKDTDAMMKRTSSRPVADGRMSQQEAYPCTLR
eukprot:Opistho-1_new@34170